MTARLAVSWLHPAPEEAGGYRTTKPCADSGGGRCGVVPAGCMTVLRGLGPSSFARLAVQVPGQRSGPLPFPRSLFPCPLWQAEYDGVVERTVLPATLPPS